MEITQRKSIKHAKSNQSKSHFRKPLISGFEGITHPADPILIVF